jgi:hypothetical protein
MNSPKIIVRRMAENELDLALERAAAVGWNPAASHPRKLPANMINVPIVPIGLFGFEGPEDAFDEAR